LCVLGDHPAEKVRGNAAYEARWRAKTRDADGNLEARTADQRHDGIAPGAGFDRQEID
jgi:hypothetical protein